MNIFIHENFLIYGTWWNKYTSPWQHIAQLVLLWNAATNCQLTLGSATYGRCTTKCVDNFLSCELTVVVNCCYSKNYHYNICFKIIGTMYIILAYIVQYICYHGIKCFCFGAGIFCWKYQRCNCTVCMCICA